MEFNAVVGHDHQKRMLSTLVERGKLPHALLFAGPRGIGKRTLALELVKHLFCERRTACNACRPCRNLAAGHHPDFALLEGETSIKIDELREIRKEVFEPPYEAPVRVILIDNGEVMTREAANALLKTLEEPPPSNLFIIITSREQEIPLTVRSRCMRIRFGPLSTDTVRAYYERVLKLPEARAEAFAAVSNGSIAAGLFWMDEEHSRMREQVAALLMGEKRPFTKAALVAERMAAKGCEVEYLSFLLSFFRDVWWFSRTNDASGLFNRDLAAIMGRVDPGDARWAEVAIARIHETLRTLRYNVNRWVAWENLMLRITRPA
jgi:DNA polymerase-3 subunit delta'